MNPETIDRIEEAVEPLADLAQQGAEFSWEVIVRQVVIEGIVNVAIAGVLAVLLAVLLVAARRCYGKFREERVNGRGISPGEGWMGGMVACLVVAALAFMGSLGALQAGIPRLLNPGFYALEEVAKLVGAS